MATPAKKTRPAERKALLTSVEVMLHIAFTSKVGSMTALDYYAASKFEIKPVLTRIVSYKLGTPQLAPFKSDSRAVAFSSKYISIMLRTHQKQFFELRCFGHVMPRSLIYVISLLLLHGCLFAKPDLTPEVEQRLQELKLNYESFILKNASIPYEKAVNGLNAMVATALEREAANAAQRRDLESLARIKADSQRVQRDLLLTEVKAPPPNSLKNIYATYRLELGKIEAARKAKTADANRRYDQALELVQDEMTSTQQVEAALHVKQLRDELENRPEANLERMATLTNIASKTEGTPDIQFTNTLGMKFQAVPGTSVLMCIHETRNSDYAVFAKATNPDNSWQSVKVYGLDVSDGEDHPVTNVNWEDANRFCKYLSEKEALQYRLPTDREWSFAVGIGNDENAKDSPQYLSGKIEGQFPWGSSWPPQNRVGNYADEQLKKASTIKAVIEGFSDGFPATAPVMTFPSNEFGFYDLGGNVWEWCEDQYNDDEQVRVLRGGGWSSPEKERLLSSARQEMPRNLRRWMTGFRVALIRNEALEKSQTAEPSGRTSSEELVRSLGGTMSRDANGIKIIFTGKKITSAELLKIGALKKINAFNWNGGAGLDDVGMAAFEGMKDLNSLMLWSVGQLSDEGLKHLSDCKNLESINIGSNTGDFTGEGLKHLAGCTKLRDITLNFSKRFDGSNLSHLLVFKKLDTLLISGCQGVNDNHVDLLLQMTSLNKILLRATSISDVGLLKLAKLPKLEEVHASAPTISKQGIELLQRAAPKLKIEYYTP